MLEVPIEISARHIHLSQADLERLFSKNYHLTNIKPLSQPGQFACKETLIIVGPKGSIDNVRILGPVRVQTQIELARTDAYKLGIKPQVRVSGDLENTSGDISLVNDKTKITLCEGVIIAQRHLHIELEIADRMRLIDGQAVSIKTEGERSIIFNNVIVRSRKGVDKLSFHLDTDEGNASDTKSSDKAVLI